ncbi:DEAD/DEAH box helicase [Oecophyllibacter saccharovorans]|uniref:DEAD/DEAH box helicase n=1 Tax=Oecophyllibacter saccharovorans TaxID=2558360 RepID=UPI00116AED07|nr:DEAD/DEAH box helicase [Oecophyllibacter saccharovorans]TPW34826.1 DEAD/DEAH box helicase [Oecophyllibacter saccharovorans]
MKKASPAPSAPPAPGTSEKTLPDEKPGPAFSSLGLSAPLLKAVEEMGYTTPTPIQAQAIPEVLAGRDVLGVAQTGTGKTASFTLPMLEKLSHGRARARMPRALILEPTRELALQVAENFEKYGKHLNLSHALLIGGSSMNEQRELLNRGVDVLIATPGRLLDLFERGGLLLMQTDMLVIDEADRMLDMGFIPDIEKIVRLLPPRHQTLFFSATMAPEIRKLADAFLSAPQEIEVARPSSVATTITERVYCVARRDKTRALRKLLSAPEVQNAIVFCNRKRDVDTLQADLSRKGLSVGHLHGDLSQPLRFSTLEKFRNGELKILVCSDVAARGIDIGGLSHVMNYDLPFNAEDYVHRIGRTGRAGKEGHAFTLMTPEDRPLLEAVETLTGKAIEQAQLPGIPSAFSEVEEEVVIPANTPAQPEKRSKPAKATGRKGRRQEERPSPEAAPRHPSGPSDRTEPATPQGTATAEETYKALPERTQENLSAPSSEHAQEALHQRVWTESPAENTLPLLKNGFLPPVPEKDADLPGFGMEEPDFMRIVYVPAAHGFIEE